MGNALEVKTMNRQQRRSYEKNMSKTIKWINSLTQDQLKIIKKMTDDKAQELNYLRLSELQTDIGAAIIALQPQISVNDIQRILVLANEYARQSEEFVNKYGKEWLNVIKEKHDPIKEEIKKLYENGVHAQNSIIKEIKKIKDFKEIPQKDIVIIFKEFKEELEGKEIKEINSSDEKVQDALNYIFKDEDKKENKEMANVKIKGKTIPKELKMEDKKEEIKAPKLKIVERKLKVEGEYSSYLVDGNTVINGEKKFNSIQDVDKYEQEKILELAKQITELKAVFQMI